MVLLFYINRNQICTKQSLYHYWEEDHILLIMVLKFGYYSVPPVTSAFSMMESFGPLKSHAPESMSPFYSKTDQNKLPQCKEISIAKKKSIFFLESTLS